MFMIYSKKENDNSPTPALNIMEWYAASGDVDPRIKLQN
jgi:hypothetical protein